MERKLKIILIALWTIIAVFLSAFLVYNIISEKKGENMFSIYNVVKADKVQKQESCPIDDIKKISLDCKSENITIFTTDEGDIKIIEKANRNLKDTQKFQMSKQGDTLQIKEPSVITFNLFGFNSSRILEVYIPRKYTDALEADLSSGNITVEDDISLSSISISQQSGNFQGRGILKADNVELKGSSGSIKAEGINSKTWTCELSSGNIVIDGISGSGSAKCTSGNVTMSFSTLGDSENIQASSGNITLYVPESESFNFEGSCTSGNINSDFNLSYKTKNQVSGLIGSKSDKKVTAKVTSGNINLFKAN